MKLVKDWKKGWKWFCVQLMALSIALNSSWLALPDETKAQFPENVSAKITLIITFAGIFGRFVLQEKPKKKKSRVKKKKVT